MCSYKFQLLSFGPISIGSSRVTTMYDRFEALFMSVMSYFTLLQSLTSVQYLSKLSVKPGLHHLYVV